MAEPQTFLQIFGLVEPVWHVCPKCQQEHAWRGTCWDCRKEKDKAREVAETVGKLTATVPREFFYTNFDSHQLSRWAPSELARTLALRAARSPETVRVVLMGPSGEGKTTLAVCMLRHIAMMRSMQGLFLSAFDVKLKVEPEWSRVDVLVLDDLGREDAFHKPRVTELIYRRRHSLQPTLVTTGLDEAGIAERYGDQDARRLFEGAVVIDVGAKGAA